MGKKAREQEEPVKVRIRLPLESDVASTLVKIIGLTYPRAMIGTPETDFRGDREMILLIDQRDRHKSPKAHKKYLAQRDNASAYVGSLNSLAPGDVSMSPNEALAKHWVGMAQRMFDTNPDAVNYLESTLYDKETGQQFVFWCARGKGRTPHALRQKAEARADAAEARAVAAEEAADARVRLAEARVVAAEEALQAFQDYGNLTVPDKPTEARELDLE